MRRVITGMGSKIIGVWGHLFFRERTEKIHIFNEQDVLLIPYFLYMLMHN